MTSQERKWRQIYFQRWPRLADQKIERMTPGQRFLLGMGIGGILFGIVSLILKAIR